MHNVHYAHVTARDSIGLGHVKKCLFGNFGSDVKVAQLVEHPFFFDVCLDLALVTFLVIAWIF